jgi:hypothetical protein
MPLWQSEHLLQHLSTLALEFPNLKKVLPVFGAAITLRGARFKTKKGKMLTPQDVKYTLEEMRKTRETEEEDNGDGESSAGGGAEEDAEEDEEDAEEEEEEDGEEDEEEDEGEEAAEDGRLLPQRRLTAVEPPRRLTAVEPPRKRARMEETPPSTSATHMILRTSQTARAAELRSRLKENWEATDGDLDAVEVAFDSLTFDEGVRLSSDRVWKRLKVLREYMDAMGRA